MKKSILAASVAMSLGVVAPAANAAFTALGDGSYTMTVTSGCFEFGNCQTTGNGAFTGNTAGQAEFTIATNTNLSGTSGRSVGDTVGSGVTTSGDHGEIKFTISGGSVTVDSFRQNSYLATAGGTFYVDAKSAAGVSNMTMDITGDAVTFTPIGRQGLAAAFGTGIGVQDWNDSKKIGMWDAFSTGTTTNSAKGASAAFSVSGAALTDTGTVGEWTGTLAATGNINGDNWTGFNNVQYSEIFNVTITADAAPAVPVPAAVWLFGSGLLGLVGVARRRKSS